MKKVHVVVVDAALADDAVVVTSDGRILSASPRLADDAAELAAKALRAEEPEEDLHVTRASSLERELAQARELARLHFDQDLTADFLAAPDGALLAVNAEFLRTFGFASEEAALGANLFDLYPNAKTKELTLAALSSQKHLRAQRVEMRSLSGGTVYAVQNVILDCDPEGAPSRIRGYISDRTAERRLEDQLLRWQRLEAVGRLAGGVAHDFNNLLTVILSYTQLLERQLPDRSVPRDMVQEMRRAGERAADLTRRLLAFGRRQSLQSRPVDVNDAIQRLLPLVESVLGPKIALELLLGQGLGTINGDVGQIEQVMMNLVVNARDAMPDGGRLTIETEMVLVDAEYRRTHAYAKLGRYVLVSVSDTGTGMPRDVLHHVFEPFFTTKEVGTGTGLGLASAHGIVEQHGGMIHAYSEELVGTTVKVYLPVAARPAASVGPKLRRRPTGGSECVLIAEDEDAVRTVLVRCLTERGYTVLEASTGEEALALIERNDNVAVAILDVVMPGIGGLATYERLRDRGSEIPIILTSGYSGELPSERFAEDALGYFVPKPYSPDAMLERVRRALDETVSDVS